MKSLIRNTVLCEAARTGKGFFLPVAASNRHIHLSEAALHALFGAEASLTPKRTLSQPGQFACEQTVTVAGPGGSIEGVRVLGPLRKETQLEITLTDARRLGIAAPVRMSGDLKGTPGCELRSQNGCYTISYGVIAAARHVHMSGEEALCFGVADGESISVRKGGDRPVVFEGVVVRAGAGHSLEIHIDTEEANAAGVECDDLLEIIRGEPLPCPAECRAIEAASDETRMKAVTEADVVDCYKAGIRRIILEPRGVVTDLAREKADALGIVIEKTGGQGC